MASRTEQLVAQFVQLPAEEQAAFLRAIADQPTPEENAELNRRIQAVRSGEASAISWDVLQEEIQQMLLARRRSTS